MIFARILYFIFMRKIIFLFFVLTVIACSKKQKDLTVIVNVKGLKKGVVYLKRFIDTTLITVDSVSIVGNKKIELYSDLDEPDLFFLYLDKLSSMEEGRISFFADKGVTEINTNVKNFVSNATIKGSKQHLVLIDYQKLITRLNHRNLDLIKGEFEAKKSGDSVAAQTMAKQQKNILKNKYLQTVNFAINHADSEVAPYLALSEIYNANTNLLDTIYKSLTPSVKASKYGKKLDEYITQRKNDN